MNKVTVRDLDVNGKKVLVRCDFNVPLDSELNITDNSRIVASLETIKYLLEHNAAVILCSHLGRPKGEVKPEFSLAPVAAELSKQLGLEVKLAKDVVGEDAKRLSSEIKPGEVVLLENVRSDAREEKNDEELSKEFASLAELYVNDAFGTCHRAHSSTAGVASFLPSACGFLIEKEIKFIGGAVDTPERPFVAILGGAKVSDKIGVIESLIDKADKVLIGGGMAYTFFKAMGREVGLSLLEVDRIELAKQIMEKAGDKLVLPIDNVVAKEFSNDAVATTVPSDQIPADQEGLDVGPKTVELFASYLKDAKTVVWNGPMGVFELPNFAKGTIGVCEAIADLQGATTIIGGGDSAAAAISLGYADKFTHISTGGGASLEYLEGKELPGVASISDK